LLACCYEAWAAAAPTGNAERHALTISGLSTLNSLDHGNEHGSSAEGPIGRQSWGRCPTPPATSADISAVSAASPLCWCAKHAWIGLLSSPRHTPANCHSVCFHLSLKHSEIRWRMPGSAACGTGMQVCCIEMRLFCTGPEMPDSWCAQIRNFSGT
jgi:hypothetical protein